MFLGTEAFPEVVIELPRLGEPKVSQFLGGALEVGTGPEEARGHVACGVGGELFCLDSQEAVALQVLHEPQSRVQARDASADDQDFGRRPRLDPHNSVFASKNDLKRSQHTTGPSLFH